MIGVVVAPIEGLTLAVDYWNIEVNSAISQVASQAVVNNCFEVLDNNAPSCQAITRDILGNIERVDAPLLNLQTRVGSGIDLQVDYGMELAGGDLGLSWISTFHDEDSTVALAGQDAVECAGYLGGSCSGNFIRATPDMRSLFSANWVRGDLTVRSDFEYIGDFDAAADAYANKNLPVDAQWYWDVNGRFRFNDMIEVFGGVSNLMDEPAPLLGYRAGGDSNTQAQLYDTIGGLYFMGVTVSFGRD